MHPYKAYKNGETPIESMEKIEVTLEICTLYKGVPYGLSLISYTNPMDKTLSFKGMGIFSQGKLSISPFTFIRKDGYGFSFT